MTTKSEREAQAEMAEMAVWTAGLEEALARSNVRVAELEAVVASIEQDCAEMWTVLFAAIKERDAALAERGR